MIVKLEAVHIRYRRVGLGFLGHFRVEGHFDLSADALLTPDIYSALDAFRAKNAVDNSETKPGPGLKWILLGEWMEQLIALETPTDALSGIEYDDLSNRGICSSYLPGVYDRQLNLDPFRRIF